MPEYRATVVTPPANSAAGVTPTSSCSTRVAIELTPNETAATRNGPLIHGFHDYTGVGHGRSVTDLRPVRRSSAARPIGTSSTALMTIPPTEPPPAVEPETEPAQTPEAPQRDPQPEPDPFD